MTHRNRARRAPDEAQMLRYVLFFGDGHFNYRNLGEEPALTNWIIPFETEESFDPERAYQAGLEDDVVSFGSGPLGGILTVLRQLSFWKMKKRARTFGETGAATLLRDMQSQVGAEDEQVIFRLGN